MNNELAIQNGKYDGVGLLLVEDDDCSALLIQKMLSCWKYGSLEIRRTDRLSLAIEELRQGGIDLVLLDLGLPDSQGLDTFVQISAAAALTPIIVLSGLDDEALATQTVQQGAQDYIVKGQIDGPSLARAIHYAIERSLTQQALTREHDLLRSVIDNIPDQVYVKDMDSRFVVVNPVTARFFGAESPNQFVGKSDFDFFPRELAEQFLTEEKALLLEHKSCINREASISDSKGNTRWVLTTKVPLRDHDGLITGLLGINRDITDRKQAEESILRMNVELERRVTERTSDLSKAMVRLEDHDRARVDFVSNVSHELKTPLTSMKYGIANLLEGVCGPISGPVIEYLNMLNTECQRMAGTVEDILDLSRLESNTMRLHRSKFLFDRLIYRGATALNSQAKTKHIEMSFALARGLGFVECDALKIVRAIINIISNAIKFTPEGGRVEIGLRPESNETSLLVLEVTDNGIGIAPQYLGKVSERFFRVGEHIDGSGLGLSIAKEVVELHGGRLSISSPPPGRDRGTRVSISLPAVSPPTVIIVDDDESGKDLFEQQLLRSGYRVLACSNRDNAMDLIRRTKPDVGIIALTKSDLSEAGLFFRMKSDETLQSTTLIACGEGNDSPIGEEILKGLGIPFLSKPCHEEDVLNLIESAINSAASGHVRKQY